MIPKNSASHDFIRILHGATKVASHAILVGKDSQRGGIMEKPQYASKTPSYNSKAPPSSFVHSQFYTKPLASNTNRNETMKFQEYQNVQGIGGEHSKPSMENVQKSSAIRADDRSQFIMEDIVLGAASVISSVATEANKRSDFLQEDLLDRFEKLKQGHIQNNEVANESHAPQQEIASKTTESISRKLTSSTVPTQNTTDIKTSETWKSTKGASSEVFIDQSSTLHHINETQPPSSMQSSTSTVHQDTLKSHEEYIPLGERKIRGSARSVPSSSIGRAWGFGSMITRVAWNTATSALTSGNSVKDNLKSEQNAILIANTLCRMRGAALKLGQMISFQDTNMVPKVIIEAFERVRNQADYMPESQLRSMLRNAYGKNWESEIFESFDINPIAAASIGQVHKAVLKNGDKVAVKVQYPGVAKSMESDIRNVERLIKYSNILPRGAFVETSIAQLRFELAQECDYRKEANNQEKYAEFIRNHTSLSKYISVPKVYHEYSSEHVLVTEMIEDAWTLGELAEKVEQERKEFGVPKIISTSTSNHLSTLVLSLCLNEVFNFRFMQTDPNWSNFFYSPSKQKLFLIDFGACAAYPTSFTHPYMEIVYGASTLNRDMVMRSSIELGFLTGEESELMNDAHVRSAYIIGEPFRPTFLNQKYDFEKQQMTSKVVDELPVMLRHRLTPPPKLSYALHRKLSGAFLLCCKFGAKTDSAAIFQNVVNQYLEEHKDFTLPPFEIVSEEESSNIQGFSREQP